MSYRDRRDYRCSKENHTMGNKNFDYYNTQLTKSNFKKEDLEEEKDIGDNFLTQKKNSVKPRPRYSDDDVKCWINRFEKFGSFRKVWDYLRVQGGHIPTEATIRSRVQGYFNENNLNYINWIKQHETASHYYSDDFLTWKLMYEEIGTYRGVASKFRQVDGRSPDHKTIKYGLKKLYRSKPKCFTEVSFEEWEGKHGRYFQADYILERWIKLFKRYGSFYSVFNIEKSRRSINYRLPSRADIMENQVRNYVGDDFESLYKEFHNPTPIPLKREKIIRELHKDPPQSFEFIANLLNTTRKTVTRIAHEEFDPITYEIRWNNQVPLSLEEMIIDDILNTQLTLRAIAEKWEVSRTPITRIAMNVCLNFRERFPMDGYLLLGTLFHLFLNSILTDFFNNIGITYFSEAGIFPPSRKRADGFLINNNLFIEKLIKKFGLVDITGIQFEFTFDLSEENLLKKIIKYQHSKILLIIVGVNWMYKSGIQYHLLQDNKDIFYPQNVKIISPLYFANIIQLESHFLDKYRELLEYNNINDIDKLRLIVNLEIIDLNKTPELEEYLNELGYSIESFFRGKKEIKFKPLNEFDFSDLNNC